MKYFIVVCMFVMAGCADVNAHIRSASVSVVTEAHLETTARHMPAPPRVTEARECPEQPKVEHRTRRWDSPPFTWPPGACSSGEADEWPNVSSVHEAECVWWFYPQTRSHSICESTWTLTRGTWTQTEDISCDKIEKAKKTRTTPKVKEYIGGGGFF